MGKTKTEANNNGNNSMKAWRDSMGYSPKDAAEALGMVEASYKDLEAKPEAPKYIKLAMQALALGLTDSDGKSEEA